MIDAIWRSAAPGRAGMLLAVALPAAIARIGGALSVGDQWPGSEAQTTISLVVFALVLPVFVAMLATGLLRGEHGPWTWGLARPISRLRLIGSLIAIDTLTVGLCILTARLILDGFGSTLMTRSGPFGVRLWMLCTSGYVALYATAAICGARTRSTIRAGAAGVLVLLVIVQGGMATLHWTLGQARTAVPFRLDWATAFVHEGTPAFMRVGIPTLWNPPVLWIAATTALALAVVGGLALGFIRTARTVPARLPWPKLFTPTLALAAAATVLLVAGWASGWALAPAEARIGNVRLQVAIRSQPNDASLRNVELRFYGGTVPFTLGYESSRDDRKSWSFGSLSPGHYEACAQLRRHQRPGEPRVAIRHTQYCAPVEIVEGEINQSVQLDIAFAND